MSVFMSLAFSPSPFHKDTSHTGSVAHLLQCDLIVTKYSAMTLFPNEVIFWGSRG